MRGFDVAGFGCLKDKLKFEFFVKKTSNLHKEIPREF